MSMETGLIDRTSAGRASHAGTPCANAAPKLNSRKLRLFIARLRIAGQSAEHSGTINGLQFVRAESTLLQALKMLRRTCAKRIVIAEYNLRRADDSFRLN